MARISGFRCDAPRCSKVSETDKEPIGWIKVMPVVDPKAETNPETGVFHLCSNGCLARFGKARYDAAAERGEERKPGRRQKEPITDG